MLAVFILYLAITVFIAWWYSRGEKTNETFILGHKKFGGTALALSERATGESAWLLLGLTGHAYSEGISAIWVALGCILGIIMIWMLMAGKLQKKTDETGAMTVSSLLGKSFPGSERTIGLLSAVIVVFFFVFYIAAQFSGSGKVMNKCFDLDPFWGIVIGSVIVTFYCMLGGFVAVVVTDVFQSILMIFTLVAFPFIALMVADANHIHIFQAIAQADPHYLSLTRGKTGTTALLFILSGLSWALGYTGQPQLLTRMMAIRNQKEVRTARTVAIVWTLLAYAGAVMIGLLGIGFVQSGYLGAESSKLAEDAEKILPVMVVLFVNPILAGVLLSGVISAMMSTASSELTVSSASITEDIIFRLRKTISDNRGKLLLNQVMTLAVGILAIILALTMTETVYGLVSYAWSGIGSSFGPALLLLLFWKKLSRAGVFASLITGTVSTVVWKQLFEQSTGISERLASFVAAFVLTVLFSLLFPEKTKRH
ncbi:MAG: sodium/proline symporter [Bacteroidota bacterium]